MKKQNSSIFLLTTSNLQSLIIAVLSHLFNFFNKQNHLSERNFALSIATTTWHSKLCPCHKFSKKNVEWLNYKYRIEEKI